MIFASRASSGASSSARRASVDAVLDELGHRFQRIALRQRDDRNRVPVVADAEIAAGGYLCGLFDATGHVAPAVEIAVVTPAV